MSMAEEMNEAVGLSELPEELLMAILNFLPSSPHQAANVSSVCTPPSLYSCIRIYHDKQYCAMFYYGFYVLMFKYRPL